MSIYNLPHDIFPETKNVPGSVIIHDYEAPVGSFKGKSILNTHAISMVISGDKTMHFAEKTVVVNSSEFHFLSASNCIATMNIDRHSMFRSILIFFDDTVLTNFYLKYAALISTVKNADNIRKEGYLAFKKDKFIYNYIESLSLLTQRDIAVPNEMKLLKFEELMLYLLNKHPQKILSFQPSENSVTGSLEIKKVVEANIVNNISIEEMAFLCNMSLSTFKRRFMKIYGTTPNKWVLQRRMEMAKDLLLHHNEKPANVYHKVGYENHSSFTQFFKQTFGLTPKDFQLRGLNVHP